MNKKIISIFLLLASFAIYDKLVKMSVEFQINLVVFYYVAIYSFIIYVIYIWYNECMLKFDRTILFILSFPFVLRLFLNLGSINKSREEYNALVSNEYIDITTWTFLTVLLIIALWVKYTQSRR